MYTRYHLLKHILPIRIKFLTSNSVRYQSSSDEEIFFNLTNDYNRKRAIHSDLLSKAIKNIHSNISDKVSLLLLTAAARCIHHVTPEKRVELLEEAWKTLNEKNVRLTTRHYETYLTGLNENGFLFDSDYYFQLIDTKQIQATPHLYSLLLHQYCREGQTDRAEDFLQILKERNINLDENIFAALIVCQLKLGNTKGANDIIQLMKERDSPPTISTYKEILTVLISEHKLDEFQHYFSQIDSEQSLSSTLYIDPQFLFILLGQCLAYKERAIFDFLFNRLKTLDEQYAGHQLFNFALQCLANEWYEYSIDFLQIQKEHLHGKHWILFFKHLFDSNQSNVIEIFMRLMVNKNLTPLDAILRVYYVNMNENYPSALNYLEQGEELRHRMRLNYFYPLFLNAYSLKTSSNWTDNDRLRLYRLLNRCPIPIDSLTYSSLLQQTFHQYHQNHFHTLLNLLSINKLESMLDRICRFLLHDIRHGILPLNILEQIAPYFRLHNQTRQEELARCLFLFMAEKLSVSEIGEDSSSIDLNSIWNITDSISKILINEIPKLQRELYIYMLSFSVQYHRKDLTIRLAEQCIKENLKFNRSTHELHILTDHTLSDHLVEQLSRYRPNEFSWQEKLLNIQIHQISRSKLEEIYSEAKEDGRYPISIQQRLLEIYIQKRLINQAMMIVKEILANQYKIDSLTYHRLFNLITTKLDAGNKEDIKFLLDLYEKSFDLIHLPTELAIRLADSCINNNDEKTALKLVKNQIQLNLNDQILQYLIQFLQTNSSMITVDGLMSIGDSLLNYRPNESIRQFWNIFFDILLEKTSPTDVVQFYFEAMRKNSNTPYLHIFQLFIEKDQFNHLQDIVDLAIVHHGSQNVLHDLGFVLIENGKIKQAERIFQMSWLKARNERIHLHALLLADSNNLQALMSAIHLTRNLPGVNQKQLFASAIRVAIRLDKSDIIDWLVKDIEENQIQIDQRVKKFLDAHLLSKGLDRLNIVSDDYRTDKQKSIQ